jgi:hypothetical protein
MEWHRSRSEVRLRLHEATIRKCRCSTPRHNDPDQDHDLCECMAHPWYRSRRSLAQCWQGDYNADHSGCAARAHVRLDPAWAAKPLVFNRPLKGARSSYPQASRRRTLIGFSKPDQEQPLNLACFRSIGRWLGDSTRLSASARPHTHRFRPGRNGVLWSRQSVLRT